MVQRGPIQTNYEVDDEIVLIHPYYGFRFGFINEVITPGKLYCITLYGYHNPNVDFSITEFMKGTIPSFRSKIISD